MNLDDLKSGWNELDSRADAYKGAPDKERKAVSNQIQSLRSRYIRYTWLMVAFILMGILLYLPMISINVWLSVYAIGFFLLMIVFQLSMLRRVKRIDLATMSVRQTIDAILGIERQRQIKRMAGIICVIPLICLMTITFIPTLGHRVILWNSCGVVAGVALGFAINRYASRLLRDMRLRLDDYDLNETEGSDPL